MGMNMSPHTGCCLVIEVGSVRDWGFIRIFPPEMTKALTESEPDFALQPSAVLVRISIASTKHHDQKTSWEENDLLSCILLFITKGIQDRNSNSAGTWLMQRSWRGTTY